MSDRAKILVVVDPTSAVQPAVDRGLMLAACMDCDLELFICHHDSRFAGRRLFADAERQALRHQALEHQLGYLNSLARERAHAGRKIRTRVAWDTPLAEGIIREVLRSETCLVLKDTHHHSTVSRTLFTNTDWHLIRDCPAPVWLVKPGDMPSSPVVLAAVDPMHEHDKPDDLDEVILGKGEELAGMLNGNLHVYHGFDVTPDIARAGSLTMSPQPVPVEEITARVKQAHADAFRDMMDARQVPEAQRHLLAGPPNELLPALARKLNAGVVIMGAIARSRLQQAVIGSTAERVLDHLPCDVLIMKPSRYESAVTYKAQARDFMELTGQA
jgi:universal stress protein E